MKDTARILITRRCNLSCTYCCNDLPEVRERIRTVNVLHYIPVEQYQKVCLTGGEPLLRMRRLYRVLRYVKRKPVFLYTNGKLLTMPLLRRLLAHGVTAVNIGAHFADGVPDIPLSIIAHPAVRLTVLDKDFQHVPDEWLLFGNVHMVRLNECDTPNEDIFDWPERQVVGRGKLGELIYVKNRW